MKMMLAVVITAFSMLYQTTKPSFDVAVIKPNMSGRDGGSVRTTANGFFATNLTLSSLLNYAFRPTKGQFFNQQLIGGPVWMRTDHFDIQAKVVGDTDSLPRGQIQLMVQSLLEDRFQLKIHREVRDLPVYDLVVGNRGLKMKRSEDQATPESGGNIAFNIGDEEDPKSLPRGDMRLTKGSADTILSANAVNASDIVSLLQGTSDRIIVDKTNLKGLFDIHIRFRDASTFSDSAAPSIFTAIQDLGLRLESAKAPFEVIVIDSVQHPTEN
ncbi:MAG TPA: TIGR03435 family protein [Terriglobia bacterium]|nr:TIGR03435 family protein [Terriglobia bacterium]